MTSQTEKKDDILLLKLVAGILTPFMTMLATFYLRLHLFAHPPTVENMSDFSNWTFYSELAIIVVTMMCVAYMYNLIKS